MKVPALAAAAAFALLLQAPPAGAGWDDRSYSVGKRVPALTLESLDGSMHRLDWARGGPKVTLLFFFESGSAAGLRGLSFIDSRTTVKTVAEEAARAQGVPTNRRHVFLDNERSAGAIRKQLDEAVYRCRMEGEIIAIGHLDKVTIQVLLDDLPGVAARGADLVKPSDLVR